MKLAIIGQAPFAADVFKALREAGHEVTGVFSIPDTNGKEDPLAAAGRAAGVPTFKIARWQAPIKEGGHVLPDVLEQYKTVHAELNVLAFCTQFIPLEVVNLPRLGSIVYHPSILPRHRGPSAINWSIMQGDTKTGFTVFYADDGLDTGDILLIKEVDILPDDTTSGLYKRWLAPEGVKGLVESVNLLAAGTAPRIKQPTEGATYDKMWKTKEQAKINWDQPALTLHNFIRGNDRTPGAWTRIGTTDVTLFNSTMPAALEASVLGEISLPGARLPAKVTDKGLLIVGSDGGQLLVQLFSLPDRRMVGAADLLPLAAAADGESKSGEALKPQLEAVWKASFGVDIVHDDSDWRHVNPSDAVLEGFLQTLRTAFGVTLSAEDARAHATFKQVNALVASKKGQVAA